MDKFKVGDKVRSISWQKGVCGTITKSNGQCFDVEADKGQNVQNPFWVINGKRGFCHFESELDLVEKPRREFIVIRRSGAETIAELRHDREVIKSGKATCAPSDTFDLDTGAKLAFDRMMGREAKPITGKSFDRIFVDDIATAPEPPKFYTGKVVCTEDHYGDVPNRTGMIFEFVDGLILGDVTRIREQESKFPLIKSFKHLQEIADMAIWIEVKE